MVKGIVLLLAVLSLFLPTPSYITVTPGGPKSFLPVWACYVGALLFDMPGLQLLSACIVLFHLTIIILFVRWAFVRGRR